MTYQERQTVVQEGPDPMAPASVPGSAVTTTRKVDVQPSGAEFVRRIVVLVFGIVQVLIGLRILLLLIDARHDNTIVRGILDLSQVFVSPFEGILHTNALQAGTSVLDLAAVTALVGWTVLELIVLWVVAVFRRER